MERPFAKWVNSYTGLYDAIDWTRFAPRSVHERTRNGGYTLLRIPRCQMLGSPAGQVGASGVSDKFLPGSYVDERLLAEKVRACQGSNQLC